MKKIQLKRILTLILAILALMCLLILSACRSIADLEVFAPGIQNDDMDPRVREYANLLEMLDELYVGEFDIDEIHAEAMRSLIGALDDEWSFYMTPDEYAEFLIRAANRFYGIGVQIFANPEAKGMEVVSVFRGSPAESGGILPGDVMTHIDGQSLEGLTIFEVRILLMRPLGEFAAITVLRSEAEYVELSVMFSEVIVQPISFELIEGDIGHIIMSNFDTSSSESFISAVDELLAMGATGFIFDVRTNSGGGVREMTTILDFLLPEGEIFVHVDQSGEERVIESDGEWLDMPAVVLVNRYSFSAAEYFAAILSEFGYAPVVGEQTSGKNRSQTTHVIPEGGALHISTGKYLTKNRVNLGYEGGLTPDYLIDHTDEELELLLFGNLDISADPHMQKAIELLRR